MSPSVSTQKKRKAAEIETNKSKEQPIVKARKNEVIGRKYWNSNKFFRYLSLRQSWFSILIEIWFDYFQASPSKVILVMR